MINGLYEELQALMDKYKNEPADGTPSPDIQHVESILANTQPAKTDPAPIPDPQPVPESKQQISFKDGVYYGI